MYSSETGSNLPAQILRRTNESWNTINFPGDDILSVVSYHNKAHGHDQTAFVCLKLCDKAICKPLHLILFPV